MSFAANADGASSVTSNASARSADKTKETAKGNGKADDQKAKAASLANAKSGKNKSVGQTADDGSGGNVSVAAALAINVSNSDALATIGDGLTVVAGDVGTGAVSVASSDNMDGSAVADGSAATGSGGTAVGVAVAINVADMTNRAVIGNNVNVTGDGVSAVASMKDAGGDQVNEFAAKATSGGRAATSGSPGRSRSTCPTPSARA